MQHPDLDPTQCSSGRRASPSSHCCHSVPGLWACSRVGSLTCPAVHTLLLQFREEAQEGVQQVLGHHTGEFVFLHIGL